MVKRRPLMTMLASQIQSDTTLGSHLVACKDIAAGDVILREEPLVLGPKQITEPVCLACYKRVCGNYK